MQTVPSERRSARRAFACHRVCSLLHTNLQAKPCGKPFASDASRSGAGGCVAPITPEAWLALYDWPERTENTCNIGPRCFRIAFLKGKRINPLELESLVSLLTLVTREGTRRRRLLVLVDSRVVLGVVSKGRSSSRKTNFLLRKRGFGLAYDIALE